MVNLDGQTLLMAVQAVQAQIRSLEAQIDQADEDEDVTDLEDLLSGYMQAADALPLPTKPKNSPAAIFRPMTCWFLDEVAGASGAERGRNHSLRSLLSGPSGCD